MGHSGDDCVGEKAQPESEVVLPVAKAERLRGKVRQGELADSLRGDSDE
jgi:hypothetical protein